MQRRRTEQVKRCDSSQGDTIMNRIHSLSTTAKHGLSAAALFAVVLALATLANAAAMPSAHSHKGKKGNFTIKAPTEVGGITLQPGDYQVKEINSPSGPVVEFVHLFTDYTVGDSGLSPYSQQVIGQVKVTEQVLSSLPKHTQLQLAPNTTDVMALEIRGDAVSYEFAAPQSTVTPDAMAVCMDTDSHE
jgi:hypothetical protein